MFVEQFILSLIRPIDESKDQDLTRRILSNSISFIILCIALLVAWDCSSKVVGVMKYVNVLIAGLFDNVYLIYYLIYRIILGNPCY